MVDTQRACQGHYICFNPWTNARGRVVNIEESFENLPHRICLPMQYMNDSVTTDEWRRLTKREGVDSLNHTMLLTYKVSQFFFFNFALYF